VYCIANRDIGTDVDDEFSLRSLRKDLLLYAAEYVDVINGNKSKSFYVMCM
jgi:hypothetical protein